MDWTSKLPMDILHHILSFLRGKEAARTCVLSKHWQRASSTNPNLEYYVHDVAIRDKVIAHVDETLSRYHEQKIRIHKFKLSLCLCRRQTKESIVSLLDKMALKDGISDLEIEFRITHLKHTVPESVFSAKTLKSIHLSNCEISPLFSGENIHCINLRILALVRVVVDEVTIQILISTCSLIERLSIDTCYGFKRLQVKNLNNLKYLQILEAFDNAALKISIDDVPNLWDLDLHGLLHSFHNISCRSLSSLTLSGAYVTDELVKKAIPQFPLIKEIFFDRCGLLHRVEVTNDSLEVLKFNRGERPMWVYLDTPCLRSFEYTSHLGILFLSVAPTIDANCKVTLHYCGIINSSQWFSDLRRSLQDVKDQSLVPSLMLNVSSWHPLENDIVKELRGSCEALTSFKVDEMKMDVFSLECSSLSTLLDIILLSCYPKHLIIYFINSELRDFARAELLDRTGHEPKCCRNLEGEKCWRHYLEGCEVVRFDPKLQEWKLVSKELWNESPYNFLLHFAERSKVIC